MACSQRLSRRESVVWVLGDAVKGGKGEPVRLSPAWEASNMSEDELNFRNVTMEDAHLQLHPPSDRLNMVYLVLLLHGIGVLMPWNMFITARSVSHTCSVCALYRMT